MFEINEAEMRQLIEADPDEVKRQLSTHPALIDRLHRNHRAAVRIWNIAHGIDPESIQKQRDKEAEANALSPKALERIREIIKDPAWTDKLHPDHKKIQKEYLDLHTGRLTMNGE